MKKYTNTQWKIIAQQRKQHILSKILKNILVNRILNYVIVLICILNLQFVHLFSLSTLT